jgi:hypothetical protein
VTVTRREFLARAGRVTALAAASAVPLLGSRPALAAGSCTLGVWTHNLADLQRKLGFTFRGIRHNQGMQTPLPADRELDWYDQGHWLIYRNANAETRGAGGGQVCFSWGGIARGGHDTYFTTGARNLMNDRRFTKAKPYLFSFHHEQIVNDRHQCGAKACGSPADYVAAYRHVRNLFDRLGATVSHGGNVRFVWTPTASQFREPGNEYGAPSVDPGPAYYDYVGVDAYNRRWHSELLFKDPVDMIGAAQQYAKKRGKRLLIAEFGVEDGPASPSHVAKATFLLDSAELIQSWGSSGPGSVVAWYFTSLDSYRLDSSPTVLKAARQIVSLPFFG